MRKKQKEFLDNEKSFQAGMHLLFDFKGAKNLNDIEYVRKALKEAVKEAKASLLSIELHQFSPQGVSGVAIISESHISIHTWPEYDFATIDIFTCGEKTKPYRAAVILKKYFQPESSEVIELKRGILVKEGKNKK